MTLVVVGRCEFYQAALLAPQILQNALNTFRFKDLSCFEEIDIIGLIWVIGKTGLLLSITAPDVCISKVDLLHRC